MRIPHEPQIIIRQLFRNDSVPSTWSLTMSSTSSRHAHSGASTSYSFSARSPLSASYRQILRATSMCSVFPLPHRLPVQHGPVCDPSHDRVPHVVLIVAAGEIVRARVGAAALLPREPGLDHAVRELQQEAELERLGQIAVEDVALVLDDDALEAVAQAGDDFLLLEHLLLAAEDAEVLVHRLAELVADLPRPLALLAPQKVPELRLCVRDLAVGNGDGRVRERPLGRVAAGPLAVGDRLHQ